MTNDAGTGEPSDEELVSEFRRDPQGARGQRAIDALMHRWRGRVFLWAMRLMREREAALDVSQEVLVQVYQALPRYEPRGRFSAWLFAIVHNRCISELRRRPGRPETEEALESLAAEDPEPALALERSDDLERVLAAMDAALAPEERLALWLRAYEGLRVEDITRILALETVSGARGVLQSARQKLREALKERRRDLHG